MGYPINFGKYLLLDRVNVGGMAEVFKAKAFGVEGFERILAIKRILPNMAEDDEFINMFVDEARIAVQLSHANIVQIYELGKFENQYYIAMEYIPGKDLRQLLDRFRKRKETLPVAAAAYITSKICEGLDYAHRKTDPSGREMKVIHRDVSPQNILVSYEGAVKVTDFGIAKAEDRASKTQAGVLKGKFGYMSPEQVRGLEIDHRSDVFAVGILLYEMVTGKRLFVGESDFSTLEKVRAADVIPPAQINPAISPELEAVVMKVLARERDERYQWASDLHDDLQRFLIEDHTIYNDKRFAALLREEYQDEIDLEMSKREEYMRLPPPAEPEALSAAHQMSSAPVAPAEEDADLGEKTMIFESGFANSVTNDAPTGSPAAVQAQPMGAVASTSRSAAPAFDSSMMQAAPRVVPSSRAGYSSGGDLWTNKPLIIAAAAFLSVVILMIVLLTGGETTGTLIVSSTPTNQVEIILDDILIGNQTPLVRSDIPVGQHILVARAVGYQEKAYRFTLIEGSPAEIPIVLQPVVGGYAPPPAYGAPPSVAPVQPAAAGLANGSVNILSSPPGAQIFISGVYRGVTPTTIAGLNPAAPPLLEFRLAGYQTQMLTPQFISGSTTAVITGTMRLVSASAPKQPVAYTQPSKPAPVAKTAPAAPAKAPPAAPAKAPPAAPAEAPPAAPAEAPAPVAKEMAKLSIRSYPKEATVYFGRIKKGVTPLNVDVDLNASIDLELAKDGYERHKKTISMAGRSEVTTNIVLKKSSGSSASTAPKAKPKSKPKPKASSCSGSGGKLSVMPIGQADCKVTVGSKNMGNAPFFKKTSPVGKCKIRVVCKSGKKYSTTKTLSSGGDIKIIIKPDDWK